MGLASTLSVVDLRQTTPAAPAPVTVKGSVTAFEWSPNSKLLAFAARESGQVTVYYADTSGSPAAPLVIDADVGDYMVHFFWITDDVLLYQTYSDSSNAVVKYVKRDTNGFGPPQPLPFSGSSFQLAVAPVRDNPASAAVGSYTAFDPLYVNFVTGQTVEFTSNWDKASFSADLAYALTFEDSAHVSLHPGTDNSPAAKIATYPMRNHADSAPYSRCVPPLWANHGATLAFADENLTLQVVTLSSGANPVPRAVGGGYSGACKATFSPDDRWLYIANTSGTRYLARRETTGYVDAVQIGSAWDAASGASSASAMVAFAPDSHALVYEEEPAPSGHSFYLTDLAGQAPSQPRQIDSIASGSGAVIWSPNSALLGIIHGDGVMPRQLYVLDANDPSALPKLVLPHAECTTGASDCSRLPLFAFQP